MGNVVQTSAFAVALLGAATPVTLPALRGWTWLARHRPFIERNRGIRATGLLFIVAISSAVASCAYLMFFDDNANTGDAVRTYVNHPGSALAVLAMFAAWIAGPRLLLERFRPPLYFDSAR